MKWDEWDARKYYIVGGYDKRLAHTTIERAIEHAKKILEESGHAAIIVKIIKIIRMVRKRKHIHRIEPTFIVEDVEDTRKKEIN